MSTLQSACGLTNRHSETHENSLEDPGVIDTKSDPMNKNEKHKLLTNVYLSNWSYTVTAIDSMPTTVCWFLRP